MMRAAAALPAVTFRALSYTRMPSFAESITARKRASLSRSASSASCSAARSAVALRSGLRRGLFMAVEF